ncbi:MAG: PilZ domain-containing protein [Gemmataceae bacterium]
MSALPSKPQNRRGSRRRPGKGSIRVTCRKGTLGLGPNIAVRLVDISEGGVCLAVSLLLDKGQEVEVSLNPPGGGKEATRKGQVAWAVTKDGEFLIGVRFDKMLNYAALGDLSKP